jgi:hypothetical protein
MFAFNARWKLEITEIYLTCASRIQKLNSATELIEIAIFKRGAIMAVREKCKHK